MMGLAPLLMLGQGAGHEWILFDVGQGDAAVYRCGERALVIDSGPRYEGIAPASWTLVDWIERRGLDDVSVALTHGHLDHTGGLAALLASGRIGTVIVASADEDRPWVTSIEAVAEIADVQLQRVAAGDRIDLGHCTVDVGWPESDPGDLHSNDRSLVLSFGPRPDRVWSPGDLERAAESRLARGPSHRWLKVAHHGGDTGTDAALLAWLQPSQALISCGAGNRYGHPDPAVLARLRRAGMGIHRTDECGFLRVRWSGEGWPGQLDCGRSGCP
jgi:competence protein ComEC